MITGGRLVWGGSIIPKKGDEPDGPILATCSMVTKAVPVPIMSKTSAAALETSIILVGTKGPLSFTLTVTVLLFCLFVTSKMVPKGRLGCAAVNRVELNISPEAVGLPSNSSPYQEAIPSCQNCPVAVWAAEVNKIQLKIIIRKISFFILYIIGYYRNNFYFILTPGSIKLFGYLELF